MADTPTPNQTEIPHSQAFDTVRRGYDRAQVDEFVRATSQRLAGLQATIDELSDALAARAEVASPGVEAELAAVTTEVGRILQTAREAAENMRARAANDASKWRTEADADTKRMRDESSAASFEMRKSAWEAATEMMEGAAAEVDEMRRTAQKDALFIRAEAEREALRLASDARREIEEDRRSATTEGERIVSKARAESQQILESARQSAENAQERARALERRRVELMEELETARRSIGAMEKELDARREMLGGESLLVEEEVVVTAPAPAPPPQPSGWLDPDATVKIVTPTAYLPSEPVDADAMAAEVAQLRSAPEPVVAVTEPDEPDEPAVSDEPAEPAVEAEGAETVVESGEIPGVVVAQETPPQREAPVIDDLFAKLRSSTPPPVAPAPPPPQVPERPEKEIVVAADPPEVALAPGVDPFEVRDRLVLPVENRVLRGVKRRLVDLQNRVLEEIRVSPDDWKPDAALLSASFGEDLTQLARESLVAGFAGAAELTGNSQTPQPGGIHPPDPTGDFVSGLAEAVQTALSNARASGSGARHVATAASKVFRAWRTDEAERRVRMHSFAAYHVGVIGGLAQLGVGHALSMASGKACERCAPLTLETFSVKNTNGALIPPAHLDCSCTIVPA